MKKILLVVILITVLILTGCSSRNGTLNGNGISPDFFTGKIEGEITVCAYESLAYRSFLEEAAREFEALYPGTKVNVETFSSMPEVRTGNNSDGNVQVSMIQIENDPQSRADYISRVNTNIMSGTGADIYAMDILPLHKFVESGVLENLDQYMALDPDFNKSDYRQNILDAIRYRDGIWFIPLNYHFSYFAYDSTLVPPDVAAGFGAGKAWSTADLFNIGIPLYDGTYKLFNATGYSGEQGGMFSQLLTEYIESFINLESRRPNFVDGSFAALLNLVNYYEEQGYIPQGVTRQADNVRVLQRDALEPADRFYFKKHNSANLISQFTRSFGSIMRMFSTGGVTGIESDDEIAGVNANADGSVPFLYRLAFAINSQSKNKQTAWAFMKFLLSKEMQLSTSIVNTGFPINNEAREEAAALYFSSLFRQSGGILTDQQSRALEDYKTAVEALSDNINTFVMQDSSLNDMIMQEVQFFINGSRTADEVARVIQNKADLYLSE